MTIRRAAKPADQRSTRILAEQDVKGHWLTGGWLELRTFIANMRALTEHVTARP